MARSGLTKSQVRTVRDRMLAEGKYPSVDAVRHALGDSGSKSTIHKYLRELRDEDPDAAIGRDDTEDALRGMVAQLSERLHADAEDRFKTRAAALQAAHEAQLREKAEEVAALRASVAALTARLEQLQQRQADNGSWDWSLQGLPGREMRPGSGFGFDSALLSSRSGQRDSSPFGMIRTVARS
jgi:hypothetical protein